jgi:phenylalanyl-tRNA synthetase beta chain
MAMSGPRQSTHWNEADLTPFDYFDLKGVVETLLSRLRVKGCTFVPADSPTFQTGRAAHLLLGETKVGVLGDVSPAVRERFDLPAQRVCLCELDLEALLAHAPASYRYEAPPRFPAVTQDLAVVVDENVPAVAVCDSITRAGGRLLQAVELFDIYRGEQIPPGKKSLAYTLKYQALDRTLTDDEVSHLHARIQRTLEKEVGAQLRA